MESGNASVVEGRMNRRFLPVAFLLAACSTPSPATGAGSSGLVVQVVRLQSVAADELAKVVQETLTDHPAFGTGLKVVAQPGQNALVLSGTPAQIGQALELVARLDVPPVR